MKPCLIHLPTLDQIAECLASVKGSFVQFSYQPQLPPRSPTASIVAQRDDTLVIPPRELVKGYLDAVPGRVEPIWRTREGHLVCLLRNMQRRKLQPSGMGYFARYGVNQGAYLWRTFRLSGINLGSVQVANGRRGKAKLFPLAR
jgi:hypothetical protein